MAVEKERRPHHDESESWPIAAHCYSAFVAGRPGDEREEPIKLTQAIYNHLAWEDMTEWDARLQENTLCMRRYLAKDLPDPEVVTTYLSYPPIYMTKITLNAAATVLIYGKSVDVSYSRLSDYTLEVMGPGLVTDWHYEDGYETYQFRLNTEYGYDLMSRRHLKVGDKYKDLIITRPLHIGGPLARDIIMDIRNEMTPEYALSAMHWFGWMIYSSGNEHVQTRSTAEALQRIWMCFNTLKQNWPYEGLGMGMVPRPPALNLLLQNPVDMFTHRYNGLIVGKRWSTRHHLTQADGMMEYVGVEKIPPKFDETAFSYMLYGMERYRFPLSFRQSKYAYGEEGRCRSPTPYPLPERTLIPITESDKVIEEAREKHPEWLVE